MSDKFSDFGFSISVPINTFLDTCNIESRAKNCYRVLKLPEIGVFNAPKMSRNENDSWYE